MEQLAEIEEIVNNNGETTRGYNIEKQVNKPKIVSSTNTEETGFIPIKWNGSSWVVCAEDDEEWFNYNAEDITTESGSTVPAMSWANAMLSDGTYKKGEVQVGQAVADEDLGSMFVWIPRFAYSINEYKIEKTEIDGTTSNITKVEFLKGTTNIGTSGKKYAKDYNVNTLTVGEETPMIVHPAFNFGGAELQGIWIAKFEASMKEANNNTEANNNVSDKTIKVVPNAESWRYINEGNVFKTCLNMKNKEEYKIGQAITHQIKNNEWGAVAYLAASQYGKIPTINDNNASYTEDGTTKYHAYSAGGNYKTNTSQSTTGNISGIYDMNGGAWEFVAAYSASKDGSMSLYGSSDIFPSNELDSKYTDYFDVYNVSQAEITNGSTSWNAKTTEANKELAKYAYDKVQLMKNKKGDAMYEVIKDFSYMGRINNSGVFENFAWLKATYDANGNVISANDFANDQNLVYAQGYYGNDFVLVGEVFRSFLLRGGYWNSNIGGGVFALDSYQGSVTYDGRFSSCDCIVVLYV